MPYSEFHFSSENENGLKRENVYSFELQETIEPNAVNLKSLSLPLVFKNISAGYFIVTVTDNTDNTYTRHIDFPESYLPDTQALADKIQSLIRVATGYSSVAPNPYYYIDPSTIEVQVVDEQKFRFAIHKSLLRFHILNSAAPAAFKKFHIDWFGGLHSIFALPITITGDLVAAASTLHTYSRYPVVVIPNHVYFNATLMQNSPYGSVYRPAGGWSAKNVLAKIIIDHTYQWGHRLVFRNDTINPEFMYPISGKFQTLDFWFTREDGAVINLENAAFSFTLALMF